MTSRSLRRWTVRLTCVAVVVAVLVLLEMTGRTRLSAADHDPRVATYAERANMPHGLAGDDEVVFVTEPLNARVAVLDASSRQEIGELPAPPGGFVLPFELELPRVGHLVVLDPGGFPSPVAPAIPRVYDYRYEYTRRHGFQAELIRTVRFDGIPIIFSEDIEILGRGRYVVSDSGFGALWIIERDGSIRPGITPASLAPGDGIPALAACPFFPTVGEVGGVPFQLPGSFAPGVGSMAAGGGYLYFNGTCSGGVARVPIVVFDDARTPHERASDIEVVSPRPDAGDFDTLKGLTFNRWDRDDDWLYAADAFHLQVVKIHSRTGRRRVVAHDPTQFNFPVSLEFLPPSRGRQTLIVASDQEHRFAALNAALGGTSIFQLPFLISGIRADR